MKEPKQDLPVKRISSLRVYDVDEPGEEVLIDLECGTIVCLKALMRRAGRSWIVAAIFDCMTIEAHYGGSTVSVGIDNSNMWAPNCSIDKEQFVQFIAKNNLCIDALRH